VGVLELAAPDERPEPELGAAAVAEAAAQRGEVVRRPLAGVRLVLVEGAHRVAEALGAPAQVDERAERLDLRRAARVLDADERVGVHLGQLLELRDERAAAADGGERPCSNRRPDRAHVRPTSQGGPHRTSDARPGWRGGPAQAAITPGAQPHATRAPLYTAVAPVRRRAPAALESATRVTLPTAALL